jgi:hypothetical protein
VVEIIDDFLHESEEEDEAPGAADGAAEDMTSTQLNKLKKLALVEK